MAFEFLGQTSPGSSVPDDEQENLENYQDEQANSEYAGAQAKSLAAQPQQQNPDAVKVAKAHATREKAYGNAYQTLQSALNRQASPDEVEGGGSGLPPVYDDDARDIGALQQRIVKDQGRTQAAAHADDLRVLAGRRTIPPDLSQSFNDAADQMLDAHVAANQLSQMKEPGAPLALSDQEKRAAAQKIPQVDQQYNALKEKLATAGELAKPAIYDQMNALKQERERLATASGTPDFQRMPLEGATQPDDISGSGVSEIDSLMNSVQAHRQDLVKQMEMIYRIVRAQGGDPVGAITPEHWPIAFAHMLNNLFPQQAPGILAEMNNAMTPKPAPEAPEPGDNTQAPQGEDGEDMERAQRGLAPVSPMDRMIQQRQNRMGQVWDELHQLKPFNSMWHVLGFVLTSLFTGPNAAAMIFSNMAKRGTLNGEMDRLFKETMTLYHTRNAQLEGEEMARHHAAMEKKQQAQVDEMKDYHKQYLNMRQAVPKGRDATLDALMSGMRGHMQNLSNLERMRADTENIASPMSGMKGYSKEDQQAAQKKLPGIHQALNLYRQKLEEQNGLIQKRIAQLTKTGDLSDEQMKDLSSKAFTMPPPVPGAPSQPD